MKILSYTILSILVLASCAKESEFIVTAEQETQLTKIVQQFDEMSSKESAELRSKILDFYAVATPNNCEAGNFGIITPREIQDYLIPLGFGSTRAIHNFTVNSGILLQDIIDQNADFSQDVVINNLMTAQFANLPRATSSCELQMFTDFANASVRIAGTYGVYIAGTGYRVIEDFQLLSFGGAFNSFIRAQDVQDTCISAIPQ